MSQSILMFALLLSPFVMLGLLSAFMPYLTRKTEAFGVTVPPAAQDDPQVRTLKRSYRNITLALSLLLAVVLCVALAQTGLEGDVGGLWFGVIIGLLLVADFALYLKFHFSMKQLKAERGWGQTASQVAVVSISGRRDVVSPLWLLTFLVIMIATVLMGVLHYDSMPDRIPMHYDLAGNVTDTAQKSIGMLLFAPGIELFMALVLAFSYWGIAKARRQIDASNPEESLEQSRRFTMAWSAYIIVLGNVLMGMFFLMQLTFLAMLPPSTIGWIAGAPIVLILIGTIFVTVKYGQGGSRVTLKHDPQATVIDRDDDSHWKLGQFYVNRDDPSLFVEKRFGVGFTLNFGHTGSWIFLAIIFGIIIASLVFGFSSEGK